MKYEYDVFISYSHHDNKTHDDWVNHFCDRLADDFRSRSGKKLNIFLDKENLNAGSVLSERLQNSLKQSRIFIPILSAGYLSSAWCRKEFLYFMEQAGRLILNGNSRIVPVRLMPYGRYEPDEGAITEVDRISGFLTEKEILYADFYKNLLPIRTDETEFDEKIALLSDDIFDLLKEIQQFYQSQETPVAPDTDAIFLGYTASGSQAIRAGLLQELQQQKKYGKINFRVLPDEAPDLPPDLKSLSAAALESFLRRQLKSSAFSIHLFDDLEGPKTVDTREPISHLQYRLAKEVAAENPAFSLFTAQSITDECAVSQEEFLHKVEGDAKTLPQLETLPAHEVKAIKDFLLEKIALREEKKTSVVVDDSPRRVFFIHDYRDKEDPIYARLDDLIYGQRHDVYVPVFNENNPNLHINPDSYFRDYWLICNKAVILLRNASTAWCNAIKVDLIKTGTEKKSPFSMAICVAEPDVARRIREVRSYEFKVIDCSQQGYEQLLIQFLHAQPNNHA